MKRGSNGLIFSASDLIRYLSSPFASWMDRYHLENPGALKPDEESEDLKLIAATGVKHEENYLDTLTATGVRIASIPMHPWAEAQQLTVAALDAREPIVYQAALSSGNFSGYADFVIFDVESEIGRAHV